MICTMIHTGVAKLYSSRYVLNSEPPRFWYPCAYEHITTESCSAVSSAIPPPSVPDFRPHTFFLVSSSSTEGIISDAELFVCFIFVHDLDMDVG